MTSRLVKAAGGIVVNTRGEIVIVNQHGNSWSMPKGHVDEGEDILPAALREIYEETGIKNPALIKPLGSYTRGRIGKGGKVEDLSHVRELTFFLFRSDQIKLEPQDPDNPEALWVTPEKAIQMLTHTKDKEFLKSQLPEIAKLID